MTENFLFLGDLDFNQMSGLSYFKLHSIYNTESFKMIGISVRRQYYDFGNYNFR